jgi:hypothetical protein
MELKLKLRQLQDVARTTLNEDKAIQTLREEARKVFGPTMRVDGTPVALATRINDHLSYLEHTGADVDVRVKTSVLTALMKHPVAEVRKVAARLLPEKLALNMTQDRDAGVRATIARRMPAQIVKEMCKRYPNDDQLHTILSEAVEEFDIHGDKRLGDSAKTKTIELSEAWYEQQAQRILEDYNEFSSAMPRQIDRHWNPLAVRRYVDSVRATSGVTIDVERLQKAVDKLLEDLDDRREENYEYRTMREVKASLKQLVNEDVSGARQVMPVISEAEEDVVKNLLNSQMSSHEYMRFFESIFRVRKANVPAAIRKYRLGEGISHDTLVPMKAYLPHGRLDEVTEHAIDRYVTAWSDAQKLVGEPLQLGWNADPGDTSVIGFDLALF